MKKVSRNRAINPLFHESVKMFPREIINIRRMRYGWVNAIKNIIPKAGCKGDIVGVDGGVGGSLDL